MDKGGEVGLSKEGLRLCWADLEGSRVPGRSSVPSDLLGPSLRISRFQRGQGQALSHTAKLVAELGPEHRCADPILAQWAKMGKLQCHSSHSRQDTSVWQTNSDRPVPPECVRLSPSPPHQPLSLLALDSFCFSGTISGDSGLVLIKTHQPPFCRGQTLPLLVSDPGLVARAGCSSPSLLALGKKAPPLCASVSSPVKQR